MQHALAFHRSLLGQHGQVLNTLVEQNHALSDQVKSLNASLACCLPLIDSAVSSASSCSAGLDSSPVATAASMPDPPLSRDSHATDPEPFAGDLSKTRGFVLQCKMMFAQRPHTFSSDISRIRYIFTGLQGRALDWAKAFNSSNPIDLLTCDEFLVHFHSVFDPPKHEEESAERLLSLRQGTRSVADFLVEFWTAANMPGGRRELCVECS